MSYLRGETYIYFGSEVEDGELVDCLQVWREADPPFMQENYRSGVTLPIETVDKFALMWIAELLLRDDVERKIDEVARIDNFGADALRQHKERIKAALSALAREMRTTRE